MLFFIVSTSKQKNTSDYTNTPTPNSPFLISKCILIKTGTACFKPLFYYGFSIITLMIIENRDWLGASLYPAVFIDMFAPKWAREPHNLARFPSWDPCITPGY